MSIDFPGELLSASSGSAGDVVATRNQHGPYTKPRVTPADPATALQLALRAHLSTCCLAWNSTLTQAEREAWERYALAVRLPGRLGRKNHAGGVAMYVRSNVPRLQAAEVTLPRIDAAPALHDLGPYTPLPRIALNFNDDTIHPFFAESDAWCTESGAAMLFYASPPKSPARNFWKGPYQYAGPLLGSDPALSSPGTVHLPIPAGAYPRVLVRARVTRADGRLSQSFFLPADYTTQTAPIPLSATFVPAVPRSFIDVVFDQLIRRELHHNFNWTARYHTTLYGCLGRQTTDYTVRLTLRLLAVQPGPDVISYLATVPDVHGLLNGVPVAAFTNFPVL